MCFVIIRLDYGFWEILRFKRASKLQWYLGEKKKRKMAILINGWALPVGGVALGKGLRSRLGVCVSVLCTLCCRPILCVYNADPTNKPNDILPGFVSWSDVKGS
jgi:hypothetical protein